MAEEGILFSLCFQRSRKWAESLKISIISVSSGAEGGRVWKITICSVLGGAEGGRVWKITICSVLGGAEGGRVWKND